MVNPRQFDVYANPAGNAGGDRPYVLVLQHDFLSEHKTRLIAPLVTPRVFSPIRRLNPQFEIEGVSVFLSPTEITVWPADVLKRYVTSLAAARNRLITALDLVFTGI